jgi:hypothetical protein
LKHIAVGLACALSALALVSTASAAIKIDRIYFDSPGSEGEATPA